MKIIFNNLMRAIGIMLYFIILNYTYTKIDIKVLGNAIKIFSAIFLVAGLIVMEKAYKNERGRTTLTSIELICLSMHSLFIIHIITRYKYNFQLYLLTSSYIIAIYYVLKSICIYTKDRKEHLKEMRGIAEIVKADEPVIKEAKKRKTVEPENEEKDIENDKKIKETNNEDKDKKLVDEETTKKKSTSTVKKGTKKTISKKEDGDVEIKTKTTKNKMEDNKENTENKVEKKKTNTSTRRTTTKQNIASGTTRKRTTTKKIDEESTEEVKKTRKSSAKEKGVDNETKTTTKRTTKKKEL